MAPRLPKRLTLPTGLVVELAARDGAPAADPVEPGAKLFSELGELVARGALSVRVHGDRAPRDSVDALALRDFHALRAIATHAGLLTEEPVTITCRNCDEAIVVSPCAAMALGPFIDGELHDPELDATFDFATAHPIPAIRLLSGEVAYEVRLAPRTLGEADALHRALRHGGLRITGAVVRALGITSLGSETRAPRIARSLSRASDDAWDAVAALFLDAHYSPRLFAVVRCEACGARNDVDAPMDRELSSGDAPRPHGDDGGASNVGLFPGFDAFAARAEALKHEIFTPEDANVAFVVDGEVAAVDDGGEPLLGSYVQGFDGTADAPSRAPEVTVYYRTFRAMWADDGPYDWEAELRETIEHELEHHGANLRGDDPVDDDERAEIGRELARVHGKRALARSAVSELGADIALFLRRTWPLWLLVVLATLAATLAETRD